MLPPSTATTDPDGRLIFVCPGCGLTLSAKRQDAGVRGPCPSCGTQVNAPDAPPPSPVDTLQTVLRDRKGGIMADSALDHQHSDLRNAPKRLWIIAMFILVIGSCLAVTWFLKDWILK